MITQSRVDGVSPRVRVAARIVFRVVILVGLAFLLIASAPSARRASAQSITRLCTEGANASQCTPVTATAGIPTAVTAVTTTHVGSTIAVTNTFQAALAASTRRRGCMLQNNGSNAMYVFFGVIGSATTSNSVKLAAGQAVSCNAPGIVLTDAVNVTGTATDAYVVTSQ